MAKLIVQTKFDTYEVSLRADVTIGRSRSNTLRIDGPQVSRNHAVVFRRDNLWQVRDLDSKNGLYVNGVSVSYSKLADGDEITIGEFRIRFVSEAGNTGFRIRTLPSAEGEDQSDSTSRSGSVPKTNISLTGGGGLSSSSELGTSMGEDRPELGSTGIAVKPGPVTSTQGIVKPQDIFFRLEDVEQMIDRWDGTSPNLFLSESLGLHKRLMSADRVAASDFSALARHLLFSLSHAVGATRGVILRREDNGLLTPIASEPASVKLTVSRIVADAALRRLCTLCTNSLQDERFRFSRSIHSHSVSSLLCVPTVHSNEVTGMIYLDTSNVNRPFRREHLHLAAFIGRMVQLFEDLQVSVTGNPATPSQRPAGVLVNDSSYESVEAAVQNAKSAEPYGNLTGSAETDPVGIERLNMDNES